MLNWITPFTDFFTGQEKTSPSGMLREPVQATDGDDRAASAAEEAGGEGCCTVSGIIGEAEAVGGWGEGSAKSITSLSLPSAPTSLWRCAATMSLSIGTISMDKNKKISVLFFSGWAAEGAEPNVP